jgi:hypothetical protein
MDRPREPDARAECESTEAARSRAATRVPWAHGVPANHSALKHVTLLTVQFGSLLYSQEPQVFSPITVENYHLAFIRVPEVLILATPA